MKTKFAHWVSEKDASIYDAMNKGAATGDFWTRRLVFCSHNVVEQVVKELDATTDVLSCAVCIVEGKTVVPHQGMFTRRALLDKYPFDTKYKIKEDY